MSGLRPIQSASSPAKRVEKTVPSKNRRNNGRELRGGKVRGGFQIGKRARDDAHIDAVEKAAQAGDHQKKKAVAALGSGFSRWDSRIPDGHGCGLPFLTLVRSRFECDQYTVTDLRQNDQRIAKHREIGVAARSIQPAEFSGFMSALRKCRTRLETSSASQVMIRWAQLPWET